MPKGAAMRGAIWLAVMVGLWAGTALAQEAHKSKPAPEGVKLYIIWPANGQVIKGGKFWLRMGLKGMGVAPAQVTWPNTGHHHVLVDAEPPPLDEPIPNDRNHLHFGKGQTEARIELPPGTHTLQLMLGDEAHVPFDPPVLSQKITITVK
jgi:hypothetical protein